MKFTDSNDIWIRDYDKGDRAELFKIHHSCVDKKIIDFFNITSQNFLGPYKIKDKLIVTVLRLLRLYNNRIIIVGKENKIMGYATIGSANAFKSKTNIVNIYMKKNKEKVALIQQILIRSLEILHHYNKGGEDVICRLWLGSNEVSLFNQIKDNISLKLKSQYIFGWLLE